MSYVRDTLRIDSVVIYNRVGAVYVAFDFVGEEEIHDVILSQNDV